MLKRYQERKLRNKIRKSIKKADEITAKTRRNILKEIRYDTPRGRALRKELVKGEKINNIKLQKLVGHLASKELDDMVMKLTPNERKIIGLQGMRRFAEDKCDRNEKIRVSKKKSKERDLTKEEKDEWNKLKVWRRTEKRDADNEKYLEEIEERLKQSYGHGDTLKNPKYSDIEIIPLEEGKIGGKKKGKTKRKKRNRKKSTRRRKRRRRRKTKRKRRRSKRRRKK